MLKATGLHYRVGTRVLVDDVQLQLRPGRFYALLGPNGAGKTTLLKLLSGEIVAQEGQVQLSDKPLSQYTPQQLARLRTYLPQHRELSFPFTAYEVALLGRMPYLEDRPETPHDHQVVRECLQTTDAIHLSDRLYPSLSGGERARVDLARVLAQQTPWLLLDEPTNHLDPKHQLRLLQHCRKLVDQGGTVIAALHDLNLASLYADEVLLFKSGRLMSVGTPEERFTVEQLEAIYDIPFQISQHPSGKPWVMPLVSIQSE